MGVLAHIGSLHFQGHTGIGSISSPSELAIGDKTT